MRLMAVTDMQFLANLDDMYLRQYEQVPLFQVVHIAPKFLVERIHADWSPQNFKAFDATPCMTTRRIESFEDTHVFNLARVKTEEVLVNRADMSVIEHLEAIKALQSDKQREIRQRILREAGSSAFHDNLQPRMSVVAQLIHLEEAA
jgi:hypothetical protein